MTAALLALNRRTFASLRYRNYRLFFAGQVVSVTGTWMQRVAQAWLATRLKKLEPEQLDALDAAIEPLAALLQEDE